MHRDWFDDNDSVINKLLETRCSLHMKLLNSKGPERIAAEKAFKENKSSLQRELRQMKNRWWSDISVEVQNAYVRKDTKEFYNLIRQVFGPQVSSVVPMKSKDGFELIKDAEGIMLRWTNTSEICFIIYRL